MQTLRRWRKVHLVSHNGWRTNGSIGQADTGTNISMMYSFDEEKYIVSAKLVDRTSRAG